jgi:hypothetical protein
VLLREGKIVGFEGIGVEPAINVAGEGEGRLFCFGAIAIRLERLEAFVIQLGQGIGNSHQRFEVGFLQFARSACKLGRVFQQSRLCRFRRIGGGLKIHILRRRQQHQHQVRLSIQGRFVLAVLIAFGAAVDDLHNRAENRRRQNPE